MDWIGGILNKYTQMWKNLEAKAISLPLPSFPF